MSMVRTFTHHVLALSVIVAVSGCGGFAGELGEAFAEGALDELNHRLYRDDDEWGKAWDTRAVPEARVQTRSTVAHLHCAGSDDEFDAFGPQEQWNQAEAANAPMAQLNVAAFQALPLQTLRMSGDHAGGAIVLVRTTESNFAKAVVHFLEGGTILQMRSIEVVAGDSGTVIRRVEGPLVLPSRLALDLDPAPAGSGSGGFDLLVGQDENGLTLAAAEGASLRIPETSLCAPL